LAEAKDKYQKRLEKALGMWREERGERGEGRGERREERGERREERGERREERGERREDRGERMTETFAEVVEKYKKESTEKDIMIQFLLAKAGMSQEQLEEELKTKNGSTESTGDGAAQ
jgi:hypothetical protein